MEERLDRLESRDRGRTHFTGMQQTIGRDRSPVQTRFTTTVPSIFSNPLDAMGDPSSDTDNDTVPSDSDDSKSEDSERDHNGERGNFRDEEDSDECKEDDSTQYDRFQKGNEFTTQASFPVSENSVECECFNNALQHLVACLGRRNAEWVSIDCLGRVWASEGKKNEIKTTVVISFSRYPDQSEELRKDLQMAMKDDVLPVEFILGRVTKYVANPFGLLEPKTPLVCGSSCAPHGVAKAGTVGGFITIRGNLDPYAVYAVTNHHVVAEKEDDMEEIPWATEQNIESHLGLTVEQSEDLADLGLNTYDREGINAILASLAHLMPTPKRTYGDDRRKYLHDFVEQALKYWNERRPDQRIRKKRRELIYFSIDQELANFDIPGQRIEHRREFLLAVIDNGLEDYETHIMEDMKWFLKLHYYELQIPLRIIGKLPGLGESHGRALFKDVILMRRLWREPPKLSRIIEHPANIDSMSVIKSVKNLLKDPPVPQEDTGPLRQKLRRLKDHMESDSRLVGTVWASSGNQCRRWVEGSPLRLTEDWALIKLFPDDGQQFHNGFRNLSRPGFPETQFAGVRELPEPIRIDVTKRGRTTDLTAGTVNGAPSIINLNGDLQSTFAIVAKPPITQFFSSEGDSGSWIMDRTGQLVGMLWGGRKVLFPAQRGKQKVLWGDLAGYTSLDLEVEDVSYFTPASYFFNRIERSFKKGMTALGYELPEYFEGRVRLF